MLLPASAVFFSGCCYGVESDILGLPTFSIYANPVETNRIPVQLIEAGMETLFFSFILIKEIVYMLIWLFIQ